MICDPTRYQLDHGGTRLCVIFISYAVTMLICFLTVIFSWCHFCNCQSCCCFVVILIQYLFTIFSAVGVVVVIYVVILVTVKYFVESSNPGPIKTKWVTLWLAIILWDCYIYMVSYAEMISLLSYVINCIWREIVYIQLRLRLHKIFCGTIKWIIYPEDLGQRWNLWQRHRWGWDSNPNPDTCIYRLPYQLY